MKSLNSILTVNNPIAASSGILNILPWLNIILGTTSDSTISELYS